MVRFQNALPGLVEQGLMSHITESTSFNRKLTGVSKLKFDLVEKMQLNIPLTETKKAEKNWNS